MNMAHPKKVIFLYLPLEPLELFGLLMAKMIFTLKTEIFFEFLFQIILIQCI